MYKCDQCGKTTSPGEKANGKVIETRSVIYPNGFNGWEIVKEIKICDSCISIPSLPGIPGVKSLSLR